MLLDLLRQHAPDRGVLLRLRARLDHIQRVEQRGRQRVRHSARDGLGKGRAREDAVHAPTAHSPMVEKI